MCNHSSLTRFPYLKKGPLRASYASGPNSHWRVMRNICLSREKNSTDTANPTLYKDSYRDGVESHGLSMDLSQWSC
ncbi:hypothetical protein TNCV_4667641 [Trichonephila clavipes]|nr:hypothetical protein TNCV_4667641 [Trichonephila clavipes]